MADPFDIRNSAFGIFRGIDGRIEQGDSFTNDRFPDLKADYILANPPFNMKRWGGEHLREDKRWKPSASETPRRRRARRVSEAKQYGKRNANCRPPTHGLCEFARVQHMIHHLAPTGLAGFVLANGSMSSNQSGEGEIRKNIIEADLVDCMVE